MKRELSIKHQFAEAWLNEAVEKLCNMYIDLGYRTPRIRAIYGFTTNGFSRSRNRIYYGECLSRGWSHDNENIIIITPSLRNEIDVLSTLGHEIAHAIDNCNSLHGKEFKKIMRDFGYFYEKNMEFPSLRLLSKFNLAMQDLGKFPFISLANLPS